MPTPALVAFLLLFGAVPAKADVVVVVPARAYYPPPVVSYYAPAVVYRPAPRVVYYSAPPVSYYAPPVVVPAAAAVTTTRYGPLGRPRASVTTYYP
jgi:hypothetical protein